MKIILLLLMSVMLTGCSVFGISFGRTKSTPVEIVTQEVERTRLELELPAPLKLTSAEWILITPENAEDVWKKLQEDNKHPVLFAITSEGYEQLSLSMAEMRNYIATQRLIIVKYQEYYEPKKTEPESDSK